MHCCSTDRAAASAPLMAPTACLAMSSDGLVRPAWPRQIGKLVRWGAALTALALIPKCPACLAAYVLLFTGIGLSLPAATAVRWALIGLSLAALAFLAFGGTSRVGFKNQVELKEF